MLESTSLEKKLAVGACIASLAGGLLLACEDARTPVQPVRSAPPLSASRHPECHGATCVQFTSVSAPTALTIDGLENYVTVSVSNFRVSASGLVVQGWVTQGSARQPGGNSAPFSCSPGPRPCDIAGTPFGAPPGRFNFIAHNFSGSPIRCGPATAEFDLMQDTTRLDSVTSPLTLSHVGGCVRPEQTALSPTTLDIGGLEGTATVTISNDTLASVSGLVVQGFITQGTARRAAGSSAPFECAPGSCTQSFNFVASNDFTGTGTLVCGPATAEFDLMQGDMSRQKTTIPITLSKRGPCP
jgi:hypothetical protein